MMYANVNYDYAQHTQPYQYVELIKTNASCDGTYLDLNDLFEKLSITVKTLTDKEKIFNLYNDCVYFGEEENKQLNAHIKRISVKEKGNIFDYYD